MDMCDQLVQYKIINSEVDGILQNCSFKIQFSVSQNLQLYVLYIYK